MLLLPDPPSCSAGSAVAGTGSVETEEVVAVVEEEVEEEVALDGSEAAVGLCRPDEPRWGSLAPSGWVTCDSQRRRISAEIVLKNR